MKLKPLFYIIFVVLSSLAAWQQFRLHQLQTKLDRLTEITWTSLAFTREFCNGLVEAGERGNEDAVTKNELISLFKPALIRWAGDVAKLEVVNSDAVGVFESKFNPKIAHPAAPRKDDDGGPRGKIVLPP